MRIQVFGPHHVIHLLLLLKIASCHQDGVCDKRPLGTHSDALPPDNRFQIEIKEIRENLYIPSQEYNVRLYSVDEESAFIAFTISLKEESVYNKDNPRKPTLLHAGTLLLDPDNKNAKYSPGCKNTIIQSDITPKTEVKVLWTAPPKDNKCVTIFALVAVEPDVWYSFEGPLSKKVCEDRRKVDDILPIENDNCQVCEDARYQMTFEGMWSPNTHSLMYPSSVDLARFSDIVGASHSKDISVFKYNTEATPGIQLLAQQGNSTLLELEVLDSLNLDPDSSYVRTLIKATAPPQPNLSTVSNFRVTRRHHMVSLATAILPSPDWFLGVSNFELCIVKQNVWADNVTFNLYPLDAGTDSGKTFESANEPTSPAMPITSAEITNRVPKEDQKPFARLKFHLVRTYSTPYCDEEQRQETTDSEVTDEGGDSGATDENSGSFERPHRTTTVSTTTSEEPAPSVDPATLESKCPMTTWSEWEPCQGECIDNIVHGYQARYREHVEEPSPECRGEMPTEEFHQCDDKCEEEKEEYYDDNLEE